jgi:hypothetical protein
MFTSALLPSHFGKIIGTVKSQLAWSAEPIEATAYNPAVAAGEAPIKQAVRWIDERLHDEPDADRLRLLDEAARRFDLSPLDADFLTRHLAERGRRT